MRRTPRVLTALLALVAATFGASLSLSLQPQIAPAVADCPHARANPHDVSLPKIRKAITCLINRKRAKRDRHALHPNRKLKRAARRHTRKMLAQDCFRHKCEGEPSLRRRVKKTGYTEGQGSWRFAEILGYENTPAQMVGRWMHTKFNRRKLLTRDFRDVGVGVGWGAPREGRDDGDFATYTIVFAWRRPLR